MTKELFKTNLRLLPVLVLAGVLGGCGGDDDDDGFESGANAAGIWRGSLDVDSGPQGVNAILIVRANGTIYMDTDIGLLVGSVSTSGNALTGAADGYSYDQAFPDGADFSLNGNVAEGDAITGAFSGSGESGTFELDYDPVLSALPAALPSLAGTYDAELTIRDDTTTVTVTIEADGDLTGTDGAGCTFTGEVDVLESTRNIYSWTATLTGCAESGSASGIGIAPQGGTGAGFHLVGRVDGGAISLSSVD